MTIWLSDEDLTTPANDRVAPPDERTPDAGPRRRAARTDAVVFLAGVWLVIAAEPVAYRATGRFDVLWNDVVVGLAVAVVAMVRLLRPAGASAGIACALGAWLVAAPFVFGYGGGAGDSRAFGNDAVAGLAIVVLTLVGAVRAREIPR
jgi:SPW repeat